MNERGHVENAVLLSVGIAGMIEGGVVVPSLATLLAIGVTVDSYWADAVTLAVTAVELGAVYVVIQYDLHVVAVEAVRAIQTVV